VTDLRRNVTDDDATVYTQGWRIIVSASRAIHLLYVIKHC